MPNMRPASLPSKGKLTRVRGGGNMSTANGDCLPNRRNEKGLKKNLTMGFKVI